MIGTLSSLNSTVQIPTSGSSSCGITITGTWVGTISFQYSIDGTNFNNYKSVQINNNGSLSTVTNTTSNGSFYVPCGGFNSLQVIMTSYTSGSASITMEASLGNNAYVPIPVTQSGNWSSTATNFSSSTSGTLANNGDILSIATIGCATVQYGTVSSNWIGTIITEISYDNGTTWFAQSTVDTDNMTNLLMSTWGDTVAGTFNNDPWAVNVAGTTNFRLRVSSFTSGSIAVQMVASSATEAISLPQFDRFGAGTISALNATQGVSSSGCSTCSIQISGTWVGTITFQGSTDNSTFFTIPAINIANGVRVTTTTANGNFIVPCGGYNLVQAIFTAYTSGTATVTLDASIGSNNQGLYSSIVSDIINTSGVNGAVSIGTSAVEARVGGSPLANRKSLTVFNTSSNILYWGYSNAVTTSNGTPIYPSTPVSWAIGPNISVYLIAASASNDSRVTESA